MSNNAPKYDRWGNLMPPEPSAQDPRPPTAAGSGQNNTGPPLVPPPLFAGSRTNYSPLPSFPIELPPPSPVSRPTGSAFGFSTTIRFGPPGGGAPSIPPRVSSISPTGGAPPPYQVHNPTSTAAAAQSRPAPHPFDPQKRYASPTFTRPICNTCHVNCVNVRESYTNFCERCFQDALRRRGKENSPKASRPKCRNCNVNYISVREGETIYCERCWQESLKNRGIREDGSAWP